MQQGLTEAKEGRTISAAGTTRAGKRSREESVAEESVVAPNIPLLTSIRVVIRQMRCSVALRWYQQCSRG